MSASAFEKLTFLEQERAARQALQVVLDSTPCKSPSYLPLAHAMTVMTIRIQDAEKAKAAIDGYLETAFRRLVACAQQNGWNQLLGAMFDADIERASEWAGVPGRLAAALLSAGYITGAPGSYVLCRPGTRIAEGPACSRPPACGGLRGVQSEKRKGEGHGD